MHHIMTLYVDLAIDATTDESMKSSVAKVREAMPESSRANFDEAIQLMAFSQISLKSLFAAGATGAGNIKGKMKDAVHGKTGNQIIAEANQIKIEREQKQKEQAIQEIKELEDKKANSTKAREQLNKFEVTRSRFYKEKRKYSGEQAIIEVSVKNGTSHPVSRAYFNGVLASPNRSIPWHEDSFNYSISGGLEPGETAKWKLAPNRYMGWGAAKTHEDAVFTVTVERLDGADGEAIFSVKEFGKKQEKRLAELKQKYGIK
jgi:hypothetical protein